MAAGLASVAHERGRNHWLLRFCLIASIGSGAACGPTQPSGPTHPVDAATPWASALATSALALHATFTVIGRLPGGLAPGAFKVAEGSAWIAVEAASQAQHGELLVFDGSGQRGAAPTGAIPTALAVVGSEAWLANGTDPSLSRAEGADSLQHFVLDAGKLKNDWTIQDPGTVGLAAAANRAWSIAALDPVGRQVLVASIDRGGTHPLGKLGLTVDYEPTGFGSSLGWCGGQVAITGSDPTTGAVEVVLGSGVDETWKTTRVASSGVASILCLSGSGSGQSQPDLTVVDVSDSTVGGLYCIPLSGCVPFGPRLTSSPTGMADGLIGLLALLPSGQTGLHAYDLGGHLASRDPVPSEGDVRLASDGTATYLLDNGVLYRVSISS